MDLYTLIITLDVPGQMNIIRLVYRDADRAKKARHDIVSAQTSCDDALDAPHRVLLADDYGREVSLDVYRAAAVQLSHLPSEFESEADIAILQGHAQNKLQRRAAADPMLKQIHPANGPLPFMPQGRG